MVPMKRRPSAKISIGIVLKANFNVLTNDASHVSGGVTTTRTVTTAPTNRTVAITNVDPINFSVRVAIVSLPASFATATRTVGMFQTNVIVRRGIPTEDTVHLISSSAITPCASSQIMSVIGMTTVVIRRMRLKPPVNSTSAM